MQNQMQNQSLKSNFKKNWKSTLILLLPLFLASCIRENDSFKPKIIITQPEADSISGSGVQLVKGYALDNQGIDRIEVNGIPLFVSPKSASQGTASTRIQNFAFKTTEEQIGFITKRTNHGCSVQAP